MTKLPFSFFSEIDDLYTKLQFRENKYKTAANIAFYKSFPLSFIILSFECFFNNSNFVSYIAMKHVICKKHNLLHILV